MVRYAPHNFDLTDKFAAHAVAVATVVAVIGHYFQISIDDDFDDIVDDDGGDNGGGH